jgi:hypothetical protein
MIEAELAVEVAFTENGNQSEDYSIGFILDYA